MEGIKMDYLNFKFNGRNISSEAFLSEEGIVTLLKFEDGKFVDQAKTTKDVFDSYIEEKLEDELITIIN